MARTVCAVQRGRADRERRIRRLTDPLHAPGASATSSTTANVAAGDQASTRHCTTGAREPEMSGVSLVLGNCPMSKVTGTGILRRRNARGGMGQGFDRDRSQRIRRMWTDCTSPNRAKYTIRPDPPYEMNGNGKPVTGMICTVIATFWNVCHSSIVNTPAQK